MLVAENSANDSQLCPAIDQRLLAAVERHGEYLGLTEWLKANGGKSQGESKPQTQPHRR